MHVGCIASDLGIKTLDHKASAQGFLLSLEGKCKAEALSTARGLDMPKNSQVDQRSMPLAIP